MNNIRQNKDDNTDKIMDDKANDNANKNEKFLLSFSSKMEQISSLSG